MPKAQPVSHARCCHAGSLRCDCEMQRENLCPSKTVHGVLLFVSHSAQAIAAGRPAGKQPAGSAVHHNPCMIESIYRTEMQSY